MPCCNDCTDSNGAASGEKNSLRRRNEVAGRQNDEGWRRKDASRRRPDEMTNILTKSAAFSDVCTRLWPRAKVGSNRVTSNDEKVGGEAQHSHPHENMAMQAAFCPLGDIAFLYRSGQKHCRTSGFVQRARNLTSLRKSTYTGALVLLLSLESLSFDRESICVCRREKP